MEMEGRHAPREDFPRVHRGGTRDRAQGPLWFRHAGDAEKGVTE
jgi:hypothetical protein